MPLPARIVVLDGHTLNPGDVPWDGFAALGELTVHDRSTPDQIVERCRRANVVLTNKAPLTATAISQLPMLRYIGVLATGYNVVDIAAAAAAGITVTNVPGYGTQSVAQHTIALLLELVRNVGDHARDVANGGWNAASDWCYWKSPLTDLTGLTLGIVGFGVIGRAVADLGRAFGMKIAAASRTLRQDEEEIRFLPIDALLMEADVVSLHCPLTPETRLLMNASRISRMKPTAFLINTARGPLIDEAALAQALWDGTIAGAALDVLSTEPPPIGNPLLSAPRCIITPHHAWASQAARTRLRDIALENLRAFLWGNPANVVA